VRACVSHICVNYRNSSSPRDLRSGDQGIPAQDWNQVLSDCESGTHSSILPESDGNL
jgi:hypothetical protein